MTKSDTAQLPLSVSLHVLDPEQRPETVKLLTGSSVTAVELWEPTFGKAEFHVQEMRRILAAAGVEVRTVHANFGGSMDISSPDSAIRSAGIQAFNTALDLAVRMEAQIVVMHPSSDTITDDERAALTKTHTATATKKTAKNKKNLYGKTSTLAAQAIKLVNKRAGVIWTKSSHSATNVPLYAIGAGSTLFQGKMDNTEIAKRLKALVAKNAAAKK